jgi:hypothetical protein
VVDNWEETASGAKIENEDPYPFDPNFTGADTDGSYPHLGTVGRPVTGCTRDGIPVPDCGWILLGLNRFELLETLAGARWIDQSSHKKPNRPSDPDDSPVIRIYTDEEKPGAWEKWNAYRRVLSFSQTPQNPTPAQAFKQAVANSTSRLSGDCLKFFQELSGITDSALLSQKLQGYLTDNVSFGDKYLDGDTLQATSFKGEGTGAITLPIVIRGVSRPGAAVTYFNAGASVFTGNLTLNSGRVVSLMEPGRITPQSSLYGLSLSEIQQLTVLHELAHAFDPKGTWDDKDDTATVVALNRALRKACF